MSVETKLKTQCCVAGGGPAGLMAGFLLGRAGVDVIVLEKHKDFLRDFRGDTIHPSTLELMQELGLLDKFLARPHQRVERMRIAIGDRIVTLADFSHIKATCQFIAFMPQWEFLDFLAQEAKRYPAFDLRMETEAVELIDESGRIVGVRAEADSGPVEILADLVIGADGRHSRLRDQLQLEVVNIGAPIDALWMRLAKNSGEPVESFAQFGAGRILVTLDRDDYWQCAYIIPKGGIDELRQRGIEDLRRNIAEMRPNLESAVGELQSWDDVSLLTVKVNRLRHWSRPGLQFIGDAAHAMSPVGGVGINLAIQDAVAAANLLVDPLSKGKLDQQVMNQVQLRREWPTRVTQRLQVFVGANVLGAVLSDSGAVTVPTPLRVLDAIPLLQRFPAHMIGLGARPEHIRTPDILADVPRH